MLLFGTQRYESLKKSGRIWDFEGQITEKSLIGNKPHSVYLTVFSKPFCL